MAHPIPGLHHVTAISGPPQENVDFYVGVLNQRLVKKTVNFDAPDTYHLYYGNETGAPGTILTFFPFTDAGPGRVGPGMASAVAYAVPRGGWNDWMTCFADSGRDFEGPRQRFDEQFITLLDPDGLPIELIETGRVDSGTATDGPTDDGFHSVTLLLADPEPTARLITDLFGYEQGREASEPDGFRQRFFSASHAHGAIIDLVRFKGQSIGRQGRGTIHHVALRAESNEIQLEWRERIMDAGLEVTPVIDRQYFKSIYFHEPGGVLFEIATDPPGFAVDEKQAELGSHIKLPPQHEDRRSQIERILPPIKLPNRQI